MCSFKDDFIYAYRVSKVHFIASPFPVLVSITYESFPLKEARHKSVGELTGGGLMQTTWLWFSSGDMVGLTLRDANRQSLARAALRGQG